MSTMGPAQQTSALMLRAEFSMTEDEACIEDITQPDTHHDHSQDPGLSLLDQALDRDLRQPCVPHTVGQASLNFVGFLRRPVCLEFVPCPTPPRFDTELKARAHLRVGFALLVELMASLLSSVMVVLLDSYGSKMQVLRGRDCCKFDQDSAGWCLKSGHFKKDAVWRLNERLSKMEMRIVHQKLTKALKAGFVPSDLQYIKNKLCGVTGKPMADKLGGLMDVFGQCLPARVSACVWPVRGHPGVVPARRDLFPGSEWPPQMMHGAPWSTFRHELYRLGTFLSVPRDFPVFPLKLAQTGFLRLDTNAIVCYFCGVRRDDWSSGESPQEVHRQLRPDCPMVTGVQCENIAVDDVQPVDYLADVMTTWSISGGAGPSSLPPPPQAGAAATRPGFSNSDNSQNARHTTAISGGARAPPQSAEASAAASRSNLPSSGMTDDSPPSLADQADAQGASSASRNQTNQDQQAARPPPPRMGLLGGAPSSATGARSDERMPVLDGTAQPQYPPPQPPPPTGRGDRTQTVTYDQLGIMTESPKKADMVTLTARVTSFRGWPEDRSPSALDLAQAGFYYAGYSDCSRCFFCGGGLKSWEPVDNPWVAHARWFPTCPYVKQCQGQDFIDVVQELNSASNRQQISLSQVTDEIRTRRAGGDHIEEPSVDPAISSTVEVGYTQQTVLTAAQTLQSQGQPVTADSLVDLLQTDGLEPEVGHNDVPVDLPADAENEVIRLQAENAEMRQRRMCKICLDKEAAILFLPCGHLAACTDCSPALRDCPVCRTRIKGCVRIMPE